MLVTGSANAINQVVERDTDSQMKRTANRPIAAKRLSPLQGWIFAILTGATGVWVLGERFNWAAALLAAFSLFLYAFIYTPLKKVNSIAVLVGALPGALPCMIGWVAGQDEFSAGGWILFAIQFFWQFPHFWAIAWVAHQDYSSVGFRLLPSREGPTRFTAMQTIAYSLLLVPVTLLPFFTGLSSTENLQGLIAIAMVILANVFMIMRCVNLYRTMDVKAARLVMFGSYLYLPLILFALLLSKATTV
jgi:protoheme IX farnesyltransferase